MCLNAIMIWWWCPLLRLLRVLLNGENHLVRTISSLKSYTCKSCVKHICFLHKELGQHYSSSTARQLKLGNSQPAERYHYTVLSCLIFGLRTLWTCLCGAKHSVIHVQNTIGRMAVCKEVQLLWATLSNALLKKQRLRSICKWWSVPCCY